MSSPSFSALITGAGRGIGAAVAEALHHRGTFVYLLGRNEKNLREIAQKLPSSQVLLCNLDHPAEIQETVTSLLASNNPPLEILVNNAGIFRRHSTLEGSDEIWNSMFQTNLLGPVRLTRALLPHFQKQRRGSIVNISSTLGLRPTADTSAYSALKAALINWTQALAQENGPHGLRVNCVCPGIVDTPIHDFHGLDPQRKSQVLEQLGPLQPLGRVGSPEEIAKAVVFLASDDSAWTTGATLSVDGGIALS